MCHDTGSRPPASPRTGDVTERGTLTLPLHRREPGRRLRGLLRQFRTTGEAPRSADAHGARRADPATPVDARPAPAERLRAGGAEVETAAHEGAPYSFSDRAAGDWAQACDDGWRRVLALTDRVAASWVPRRPRRRTDLLPSTP